MGNCGWNFTILGLKDADLRVESDATNRLCVQWLVAEIFTKRPKHQIQQDHIWGYTAITKKHHIYQVLKPLEMRTQPLALSLSRSLALLLLPILLPILLPMPSL